MRKRKFGEGSSSEGVSSSPVKKQVKYAAGLDEERQSWIKQNGRYFTSSVISLSLMGRATEVTDTNSRRVASIDVRINPLTREPVTAEQNRYNVEFSKNLIDAIDSFPLNASNEADEFIQLFEYAQQLNNEGQLEEAFPNWQYIDFSVLKDEIFSAYRTAQETIKIKLTFEKMITLYREVGQNVRVEQIQSQENTVLNAVATYIKEKPTHEVTLKIIMPRSHMTGHFTASETHLISDIQWQAGQCLSRISGILIEIRSPQESNQPIAYRYVCGLNAQSYSQEIDQHPLVLRIKKNSLRPTSSQRANSFLGMFSTELNRALSHDLRSTRQYAYELFQSGSTACNIGGSLTIELIDRRNPSEERRHYVLNFPQQTIEVFNALEGIEEMQNTTAQTTEDLFAALGSVTH